MMLDLFVTGSYFARDAAYSHLYTDRPSAFRNRNHMGILQHLQGNSMGVNPFLPMYIYNGGPPGLASRRNQSVHLATRLNALISLTSGGAAVQIVQPQGVPPQPSTSAGGSTADTMRSGHMMFVSRCLVGQYTQGRACLRKPPPLDPSDPYGKSFDTCVDNVNEPKIYVIFDSSQCYPEYIIEYTNEVRT